ncbi:MAG: uridylate kinase [Clostridiales bacterium]|jgi:glutamate 5-kinase|nr:uridylate kinase [Clostridiales bacterium]
MSFNVELVGKIGSMALIDTARGEPDDALLYRLAGELRPGMVWVTSGATEIGRLDYIKRSGRELTLQDGDPDEIKTDYASQGQTILMQKYRQYVSPLYSIRQVLVEHQHFNDPAKREHIKALLIRAARQNAVPIINYNDAVSFEETRKMEIQSLREKGAQAVELVDNDETAGQIACLVGAKTLVILTSADGIYRDPDDPKSLIEKITGASDAEILAAIGRAQASCRGASRAGAAGARAKLEYVKAPALQGTEVVIANAKYPLQDILNGAVRRTVVKREAGG